MVLVLRVEEFELHLSLCYSVNQWLVQRPSMASPPRATDNNIADDHNLIDGLCTMGDATDVSRAH